MTKKERLKARKKAYEMWAMSEGQITYIRLAEETGLTVDELKRYKGHDKWLERYKKDTKKGKFRDMAKEGAKKIRNVEEIDDLDKIQQIIDDNNLTDREGLFVIYYLQTFNATQAAKKAGFSASTAHIKGHLIYKREKVNKAIKEIKKLMYTSIHITAKDLINEYIRIAFADITDYVEFDGHSVKMKESGSVDGRLITEVKSGRDGISIKLADKLKALDKLEKLFELMPDRKLELERDKFDFNKQIVDKADKDGSNITIVNDIR